MSVKAISWAFEAKVGNKIAKLVLLALADHANDQHECWPGAELVGIKAEIHRATVFRAVNYLIEHGFVVRKQRLDKNGSLRTPKYILNIESIKLPLVAGCDNPVAQARQPCRTAATVYEPTLEPPLEPKIDSLEKSEERVGSKEESGLPKKRKPRHGQRTKDGKRLWLDFGTMEWEAYADDHRKAHNGMEPLIQWNNSGSWFNLVGETGKGH